MQLLLLFNKRGVKRDRELFETKLIISDFTTIIMLLNIQPKLCNRNLQISINHLHRRFH